MCTLDVYPESTRVYLKTLRESLAIDQRRWKNISVAHSTRNSLEERALYVFFAPATEFIGVAISHYKGNTFIMQIVYA